MDLATVPIVSLTDKPERLAAAIGASFRNFGFAMVRDHGIDPQLIDEGWRLTREFFALPEAEKRALFLPDSAGAHGYTPFGREIAKNAPAHDLKEFWHIGRDLPAGHPLLCPSMPPNSGPRRPPVLLRPSARSMRPLKPPVRRSCRTSPPTLV